MTHLPHRPFLVVVSAPSGTGKTTVCRRAIDQLEGTIRFSVSHTTRPRRPGEVDTQDYHFTDGAAFDAMRHRGEFLEWANVYGNCYGTSRAEIDRAATAGIDLLVEIDVQGARQVLERVAEAVSVFILPPSLDEMERRLRARGTDDAGAIARRLAASREELHEAPRFHYWIVNAELDDAVRDLVSIVRAERRRRSRAELAGHPLSAALPPR